MKISHLTNSKQAQSKPILLRLSKKDDAKKFKDLLKQKTTRFITDEYEVQLEEYFQVQNPPLVYSPDFKQEYKKYVTSLKKYAPLEEQGVWVYYPWLAHLVHVLDEKAFFAVRTTRNQNLITKEEQKIFYNAVIGIAGLSVGNSVALSIVLQGGGRHIKLADYDTLELSNTNRIRTGIDNLGLPKVEMTARQIYLLNPFAKIELFKDGLTKKNIATFFTKLDVVIDELDNLAIKHLIREYAKKNKLPVVMAADNGDNGVVDIERYDNKKQPQFFHGRIGKTSFEKLAKLDKFGIGKTITQHIGPENVTEKTQNSLLEMGKTIVSWPQLGGAALLNGSAVAYCVRKIVNDEPLELNRALISLDEKLIPDYNSKANIAKRKKVSTQFRKIFGL